jgi:hypothetical protein
MPPTGKSVVPQISQRPPDLAYHAHHNKNDVGTIPQIEVERVKEHYEDANKSVDLRIPVSITDAKSQGC